MAKQLSTAKDLNGSNIYHIKNQTIYYNKFDKTAYIITNANAQSFSNWQLKGSLCIMLACALIILKLNVFLSIGIGLLAYVISTIVFNKKYLPTLAISTTFVRPPKEGFFKEMANKYSFRSLKIMFVMFIIIAIVMFIVGEVITKYEGTVKIVNIVTICLSLVAACIMGYTLKIKKNN